ncbi:hypothetical protein ACFLZB_04175 [Nanoarchaeota archaeon]
MTIANYNTAKDDARKVLDTVNINIAKGYVDGAEAVYNSGAARDVDRTRFDDPANQALFNTAFNAALGRDNPLAPVAPANLAAAAQAEWAFTGITAQQVDRATKALGSGMADGLQRYMNVLGQVSDYNLVQERWRTSADKNLTAVTPAQIQAHVQAQTGVNIDPLKIKGLEDKVTLAEICRGSQENVNKYV